MNAQIAGKHNHIKLTNSKMKTIGQKISPILGEIEDTLWEYEARNFGAPEFTDDGFRAALKIFMSVLMDKMWRLQGNENMDQKDREMMAQKLGNELRNIVKVYTDVDTYKIYEAL